MNTLKTSLVIAIAFLSLVSCSRKKELAESVTDQIEITTQQFITDSMQLGRMEFKVFESSVECNGIVVPLAEGKAKLNAPVSGVVKKIYVQNGQHVDAKQILIELSGTEIIDVQKDYAESAAQYKRLKSEFERIKTLFVAKVSSEKEYVLAETDFKIAMARYNGLKMKIEDMGFIPAKIENGEFYSGYQIRSPISGYISQLNVYPGTYINPSSELFEIIDPSKAHIRLSVFASDISKVKMGQRVRISQANGRAIAYATITAVGIAIDEHTKTFECYASHDPKSPGQFFPNEMIESEIIVDTDTVMALPSEAIIKTESGSFILVLHKHEKDRYWFNKIEAETGRQYNGYTEILNKGVGGNIITRGVYNSAIGI